MPVSEVEFPSCKIIFFEYTFLFTVLILRRWGQIPKPGTVSDKCE
jgi:hypothetical protein